MRRAAKRRVRPRRIMPRETFLIRNKRYFIMKQFVSTGRPAGGLAAVSFFDGLVFFAPVSLLVRTTAGVTVSQFFLLQAAIACTVLAAELPAGRLTDRIGYRSTIVLCEGGFLAARALLLAAFLTRSLPLFVLEAAVEGLAISFESGTRSAYLYLTVPPELYLTRTARVENWGTAGFIASTVCYAGLYALWGLTGLLAATVCTSALAFLSALRLPQEPAHKAASQTRQRPAAGLLHALRGRKALVLIATLAAVSMGQLLVNFFYADKLRACGLREEWMTPLILGYSALGLVSEPVLARIPAGQRAAALAGFFLAAGAAMLALGFVNAAGPAILLMLALPLLLRVPACLLERFQNDLVDELGEGERRAELLSAFNMSGSFLEVVFLVGSAAVAAAGAAFCFGAVGLLLAALSLAARRALD